MGLSVFGEEEEMEVDEERSGFEDELELVDELRGLLPMSEWREGRRPTLRVVAVDAVEAVERSAREVSGLRGERLTGGGLRATTMAVSVAALEGYWDGEGYLGSRRERK